MNRKFRVLVVDDSLVDRMLISHILNSDPRIEVAATAESGAMAISMNESMSPDVIIMDVTMPGMDGFQATSCIMQTKPVPIIICTGHNPGDSEVSFKAIEAGALSLVGKPEGPDHADYERMARSLVESVVTMAEVKVVRRWSRERRGLAPAPAAGTRHPAPPAAAQGCKRLVVIGASTGGPPAIQSILGRLPRPYRAPVLIVQHISPGFIVGMATWLQGTTGFPVRIATHGETAEHDTAYLAPDDFHLEVSPQGTLVLNPAPPIGGLRPAVSRLFGSVAASPCGSEAAAVLLTGMGRDGADELLVLRNLGALTIAQDAESSVVHGMPGEAIHLGAAAHVLPPEGIALVLSQYASPNSRRTRP